MMTRKLAPALLLLTLLIGWSCSQTTSVVSKDTESESTSMDLILADVRFGETQPDQSWYDTKDSGFLDEASDMEPEQSVPDVKDVKEVTIPDVVEEVVPDIVDVKPDDSNCTPFCGGKSCGPDGCGGICGFCAYGSLCMGGDCVESICPTVCEVEADVEYLECGDDGCGGYCGFCLGTEYCGLDGYCYAGSCQGSCSGKVCGDDGCGHSCGNCQALQLCTLSGQCIAHPCGAVTYKGACTSKYTLVECIDLSLQQTNCLSIEGHQCGWDEEVGKYDCVPETACVPQCLQPNGKPAECGPDGCWGLCGVCPDGWGCDEGLCRPAQGAECAWIDNIIGQCIGTTWWFCASGILYGYDCMAQEGNYCAWDTSANFGAGGYSCLSL